VAGDVLGRQLTRLMDELDMTVYAAAQAAHMSERHVAMLRRGEIEKPRPETIRRLAVALDVSVEMLLGDHPGVTRVTVAVPDELADVLHALAAIQLTSTDGVVEHEVRDYLRRRRDDDTVKGVINAMKAARQSDNPVAAKSGS
jgi:transcriptional regulator with XRE-family HTH domain